MDITIELTSQKDKICYFVKSQLERNKASASTREVAKDTWNLVEAYQRYWYGKLKYRELEKEKD